MIGIEEGYKGYCKLILFIVGESKNQVMLQYCTRLIPWVHPEEQCQSGSIPMQEIQQIWKKSQQRKIKIALSLVLKQIDIIYSDFSRTPDGSPNPWFFFIQIVQRIGGGQLGLRLHFQNGPITKLGEIWKIVGWQLAKLSFSPNFCCSKHVNGVAGDD